MFIKQLEYDVMGSPRKELTQFYGNLEGFPREVISEWSSKERVKISQAESRWEQAERVACAEPRGWVTWHSLGATEVLCGGSTGRVLCSFVGGKDQCQEMRLEKSTGPIHTQ